MDYSKPSRPNDAFNKGSDLVLFTDGTLQTIFLVLKLTKFITWSWWWVLAPTWIPALLIVLLITTVSFITDSIDRH